MADQPIIYIVVLDTWDGREFMSAWSTRALADAEVARLAPAYRSTGVGPDVEEAILDQPRVDPAVD